MRFILELRAEPPTRAGESKDGGPTCDAKRRLVAGVRKA
jgi:hypothetical protein